MEFPSYSLEIYKFRNPFKVTRLILTYSVPFINVDENKQHILLFKTFSSNLFIALQYSLGQGPRAACVSF